MNKIKVNCNLTNGDWSLDISDLGTHYSDLFISFKDNSNADPFYFNNLNFLYRFSINGQIVSEKTYPPVGIKYFNSSDDYLVVERLNFDPGKQYTLYLSVENNGQFFEKSFTFLIPFPTKPYNSWTWNEITKDWQSPVSFPKDGRFYDWDEKTLSWIKNYIIILRFNFILNLKNLKITDTTSALDKIESMFNSGGFSKNSELYWKHTTIFDRKNEHFIQWAKEVELIEEQLDELFK